MLVGVFLGPTVTANNFAEAADGPASKSRSPPCPPNGSLHAALRRTARCPTGLAARGEINGELGTMPGTEPGIGGRGGLWQSRRGGRWRTGGGGADHNQGLI
ncbi:hypothetical protein PAHAL_5G097200 [Panicum hallii]|uniref:Uncharacterized protein n=1 Tax=Panicum hallii TaxID=206008 RepID=A0A2T8IJG6_9POAL|nr:hypothetical protein PAHAL_5G097200 [Panicum hallii]